MTERNAKTANAPQTPTQKMPSMFFVSDLAIGQLYTSSKLPYQLSNSKELPYKQFSHSIGKTPDFRVC